MKSLIVLALLTVGVNVAAADEFNESILKCYSRFGDFSELISSTNDIVDILNYDSCSYFCYLFSQGLLNKDGSVNKENIVSMFGAVYGFKDFPEEEYNRLTGLCDKVLAGARKSRNYPCMYTECLGHDFMHNLVNSALKHQRS